MKPILAAAALMGLGLCLLANGAQAHVTIHPSQAPAGETFVGAFRVGHGCAGGATTALRIEFPPEVAGVKPQPKAGWTVEIDSEPQPGSTARRVNAITWKGRLPDDQFDDFTVMARAPDAPGPLYFNAIQSCDGVVERWTERPAAGQSGRDLRHPAPVLLLTAASSPPRPAPHASAAADRLLPAGVKAVDGALFTSAGAPLFIFKMDTMVGMSHCEGECAKDWPPLLAPKAAKPPSEWNFVQREDGSLQWAFRDHPLYTTRKSGDDLRTALSPQGVWAPASVPPK